MPDRPRRFSPMFRGSLAFLAILLSVQCGTTTSVPECTGPNCDVVPTQPPTLSDPTAAVMCALQAAAAQLIAAAGAGGGGGRGARPPPPPPDPGSRQG